MILAKLYLVPVHLVRLINSNSILGYTKKNEAWLFFCSGQSFDEPGLLPVANLKQQKQARYTYVQQVNANDIKRWLQKAAAIQ